MKVSKYFVVVTAVFITSLLTANIIAVKLTTIFGFFLPAGVIIFPISYIFIAYRLFIFAQHMA